jgi:hypothetical protein
MPENSPMPSVPFRPVAALRAATVFAAVAFAAACSDSPTKSGPDVEIESVRLTVTPPGGGAPVVYTLTANGSTPSPVQLRVGTSTLTAVPLGDKGQSVPEATEFELRLTNLPASVTFTRNGSLTAPVAATAATAATPVRAEMFHKGEGHTDYTANFSLVVVP